MIDKKEILYLAHLSRLQLYEHEIDPLTIHIDAVLQYAQRVQEVAIGQQSGPDISKNKNVMRADHVVPTVAQTLLQQAPSQDHNYFVVPVVVE